MLVKGEIDNNQLITDSGVFVVDNDDISYKGVFEITNIRSEEVEREIDVDGRKMKIFVPKLKADILTSYREIDNKEIAHEKDVFDFLANKDFSEDVEIPIPRQSKADVQPSIELTSDDVQKITDTAPEISIVDKIVVNVNEHEKLFGKELRYLDEFKIDPTADRKTIARQATLLNAEGFVFDPKSQTYTRSKSA